MLCSRLREHRRSGDSWRAWRGDPLVEGAIEHLREKFASVISYGPRQVVAFYDATSRADREMQARRAFELVVRFLTTVDPGQR